METNVSIGRLPQPSKHFVGRDEELESLDSAWNDQTTNIVELVAFGGVGKSALTAHWLQRMRNERWRDATHVFGYSFYSQGLEENFQASADEFLYEGLRFFGDPDPSAGSPWDKGERLARLIQQQRTLLILDGVEPLQYPASAATAKQIQDPGLQSLVRELAGEMNGLCLISTRFPVQDIEWLEQSTVQKVDLENLSEKAGGALLQKLGVDGTDKQREVASREVKGHGLALNLLGRFLFKAYEGNILRLGEFELFKADEKAGSHAMHILRQYEKFLGDGPELSIVRLLGLFDRPANSGEIGELRRKPAIPGLTELLVEMEESDWNYARNNLCEYGLLDKTSSAGTLDAHALVREYFSNQLSKQFPDATHDAHCRLFEFLERTAKPFPATLAEMMPLFHAVRHGCKGGLADKAILLHKKRIQRDGNTSFAIKRLGAGSSDLAACTNYFVKPWETLRQEIQGGDRAAVFNWVAFRLSAAGRRNEAIALFEQAADHFEALDNWQQAAINLYQLSNCHAQIGKISHAIALSEKGLAFALRSKDLMQISFNISHQAHILCNVGLGSSSDIATSFPDIASSDDIGLSAFGSAEWFQSLYQPSFPKLFSGAGFVYCAKLLDDLEFAIKTPGRISTLKVESTLASIYQRCTLPSKTFASYNPFEIGLDEITQGRASLVEVEWLLREENSEKGRGGLQSILDNAKLHIENGIECLRQFENLDFICIGLQQRAAYRRLKIKLSNTIKRKFNSSHLELASNDLNEIGSFASQSNSIVWQIEVLLERCRLFLESDEQVKSRKHLDDAVLLVQKTESVYTPYEFDWTEFGMPSWINELHQLHTNSVLSGDSLTLGYYRRNREIDWLQRQIE